jgi:hypothetical protein
MLLTAAGCAAGGADASGATGTDAAAGNADGATALVPVDSTAWVADPLDEGPALEPAASGPLGFDVAACGVEPDAPPGVCRGPDEDLAPPPGTLPVAPPAVDCATADARCQEPDHCAPGTDPDCAPLGPAGDPDCAAPDGICDEGASCAAGTDPDCDETEDGEPVADPLCATPDGFCDEPEPCALGTDPDCVDCETPDGVCDEDSLCDPDLDPDCAPVPAPGPDEPPPAAPAGDTCAAPVPGEGTCTVVCCDDTRFTLSAPDAETCRAQWRQCGDHRKTVAISFAQPACENTMALYQRTEPCLECCALCVGARREKFVDVATQCTEAATAFCTSNGRGGLLEARWGVCGGPQVDGEDAAGLTDATFDVESEADGVDAAEGASGAPKQAVCAVVPTEGDAPSKHLEVVFNDVASTPVSTAIKDRYRALLQDADEDAKIRLAMFQIHDTEYLDALTAARRKGDLRVVLDGKAKNHSNTPRARLWEAIGADNLTVCRGGACIGEKINHNKFLLVSKLASDGSENVVAHASQNFVETQDHRFNHLVVVRGAQRLFEHFESYWNALRRQERSSYDRTQNWKKGDPDVTVFFFPRAKDPVARAIRSVDCGTPDAPNSIRVNMAFFNADRKAVYTALRKRRLAGCTVDVLMGAFHGGALPSPAVIRALRNTNQKIFRRGPRGVTTHSKYMLIREGGRKVVFAGSHNYTRAALRRNDEAMLRIRSAAVYDAFNCDMERAFAHPDAKAPAAPSEPKDDP